MLGHRHENIIHLVNLNSPNDVPIIN